MSDVTARIFDAMAASYDELEPWYEHLYARLHEILRSAVPGAGAGALVLDAGCGTGFQTAIVGGLGYRPHGLDLSAASLAVARERLGGARLVRGDLAALPYREGAFDAVVCAGSAIDFVPEPRAALAEIARVMRRGAWLFLEYERRWCLDIGWMVASGALGDPLGYGLGRAEARAALARPWGEGIWVDYPGYPRLRLFTDREVDAMLADSRLVVERAWGIHALTNLLPSTVLHRPRLPRALRSVYRGLCAADSMIGDLAIARGVSAHGVLLARKR